MVCTPGAVGGLLFVTSSSDHCKPVTSSISYRCRSSGAIKGAHQRFKFVQFIVSQQKLLDRNFTCSVLLTQYKLLNHPHSLRLFMGAAEQLLSEACPRVLRIPSFRCFSRRLCQERDLIHRLLVCGTIINHKKKNITYPNYAEYQLISYVLCLSSMPIICQVSTLNACMRLMRMHMNIYTYENKFNQHISQEFRLFKLIYSKACYLDINHAYGRVHTLQESCLVWLYCIKVSFFPLNSCNYY